MGPVQGYRFANWKRGYGDFGLAPDWLTLRPAAWLAKTALVVCDVVARETRQLVSVAPRSILRRQVERASALGYQGMAGSELEYYVFSNSYREAEAAGYANLEQAGCYVSCKARSKSPCTRPRAASCAPPASRSSPPRASGDAASTS
ncbi:MAG: hypothetical protein RMI94_05905 [Bryobacterales bacterium]|nr:hypothetical protein [Bryobacterales bacterium]